MMPPETQNIATSQPITIEPDQPACPRTFHDNLGPAAYRVRRSKIRPPHSAWRTRRLFHENERPAARQMTHLGL